MSLKSRSQGVFGMALVMAIAVVGWARVATAQDADMMSVDRAATAVYRLNDGATYTEGCFPPCRCAIWDGSITGTFGLTLKSYTPTDVGYKVSDINWYVRVFDREIHITGTGSYQRNVFFARLRHRMTLKLSFDGADSEEFDTGWVNVRPDVSADAIFPNIRGLTLSMNDLFCYDIAIGMDASPVARSEMECFTLGPGSSAQEGCLDPCDCPLYLPRPMRGTFFLVKTADFGTVREFAVVNATFAVIANSDVVSPNLTDRFEGFGRYTEIDGFAGPIHRMELTLDTEDERAVSFDSGLVNTLPSRCIHIDLARNGFYCLDTVLRLRAHPCDERPCPTIGGEATK